MTYGIILVVFLNIIFVHNRIIPIDYYKSVPDELATSPEDSNDNVHIENNSDSEENNVKDNTNVYGFMNDKKDINDGANKDLQKPCSVVVLSNVQNPNVQSLLRKYRYDANGSLIPSSVKYYMKLPQGEGPQSVLLPLKDKAFSPVGGFVRYYKEVPPIPQTWV